MSTNPTTTVATTSPGSTKALGAAIAARVEPGDVILLFGELGAGKTTFTKGFVAALGGTDAVTSPTFTICHRYEGRIPVAHVDCYRIDPSDDLSDLALEELLDDGCVVVVEWGAPVRSTIGSDTLECTFDASSDEDERRTVVVEATGPRWIERWGALVASIEKAGVAAIAVEPGGAKQ